MKPIHDKTEKENIIELIKASTNVALNIDDLILSDPIPDDSNGHNTSFTITAANGSKKFTGSDVIKFHYDRLDLKTQFEKLHGPNVKVDKAPFGVYSFRFTFTINDLEVNSIDSVDEELLFNYFKSLYPICYQSVIVNKKFITGERFKEDRKLNIYLNKEGKSYVYYDEYEPRRPLVIIIAILTLDESEKPADPDQDSASSSSDAHASDSSNPHRPN